MQENMIWKFLINFRYIIFINLELNYSKNFPLLKHSNIQFLDFLIQFLYKLVSCFSTITLRFYV